MAWPAGTTRGPSIHPKSIAFIERDVEQQAAGLHEQAEVAHRREPGAQRAAGVGDRPQRPQGRVVLHRR